MKKLIESTRKNLPVYIGSIAFIVAGILSCEEVDYTFVPDPIEAHTITNINPTSGDIGTSITINGTNFSPAPSNNKVSFNGVLAEVTAAADTLLTVTVPEGATTGNIVIAHSTFTADGPVFTVVDVPTISDVDPVSAGEGDEVTITGTKFSDVPDDNIVVINGMAATVTDVTETSITTSVPTGSAAGSGDIMVTVNGQTATFPGFTIVPVITNIDPLFGDEGAVVTITGTSFSTTATDNTVDFNGTTATVTASTTTSITTTVPVGVTTGAVSVSVGGQTATGPDFTPGAPPTTLVIPLDSNDDDVEEVAEAVGSGVVGEMDLTSSDLELGESSSNQGLMNIGLRFNNVVIPQGATIAAAKIQFRVKTGGSNEVELTIYGENVASAAPYTGVDGEVSARALTNASVVWNIEPWLAEDDRLPAQQTVDLSAIIQEVVNRPDWVSGNSINFIMKHTGVSVGVTSTSGGREALNYSSSTAEDGAELTVTYQ